MNDTDDHAGQAYSRMSQLGVGEHDCCILQEDLDFSSVQGEVCICSGTASASGILLAGASATSSHATALSTSRPAAALDAARKAASALLPAMFIV